MEAEVVSYPSFGNIVRPEPQREEKSLGGFNVETLLWNKPIAHSMKLGLCSWVNLSPDLLRVNRINFSSE